MAYLIIPIVCFALLAGLVWVMTALQAGERVRTGRIDDLDLILSVLMTAEWEEPSLVMKVPRRVTSVKMTFPGSAARLEMPLVTRLQKSRIESYLAMLRDLGLGARVSSHDGDDDVLEWEVEGPPAKAAAIVKDAFVGLFEVDPGRVLEFRVRAHPWDQNVIEQGLRGERPGDKAELPTAASQGHQADPPEEERAGCLKLLAGVLLLPLPFMVAYLQFGYLAASAVLVAIIVFRELYRRWKRAKGGSRFGVALKVGILLLTGTTIYFNDPLYLQLIPTAVLMVVALAELLAVSLDMPNLSAFDPKGLGEDSKTGRRLFALAVIATCAGGAALNEYLRTNLSLDAWVWFFAFFRIELILGFLVTSIPLCYYMWHRIWRTEGDSESP